MPAETPLPAHSQSRYQVRLHVGVDGEALAGATADAHVVVLAEALPDAVTPAVIPASGHGPALVRAGFRTRSAAARAVLDEQARRGDRAFVAVVTPRRPDGDFAVEDFLLAGAVVDALATLGIDYSSPEAAAACAAFTGLRGAVAHLVSASGTGQRWIAAGRDAELRAACQIDADDRAEGVA